MFLTHHWQWKRLILYSSVAAFGFLPFIHWCIVSSQETVMLFYPKVLILYVLGSVGALIYATKFPEIFIPGRVDIFGASHQWWHIFVALALVWWHRSSVELFLYRVTTSCPMTEKQL
jgi:adiponectin receptor